MLPLGTTRPHSWVYPAGDHKVRVGTVSQTVTADERADTTLLPREFLATTVHV
jgi:flavin-dependent dehydrogenase